MMRSAVAVLFARRRRIVDASIPRKNAVKSFLATTLTLFLLALQTNHHSYATPNHNKWCEHSAAGCGYAHSTDLRQCARRTMRRHWKSPVPHPSSLSALCFSVHKCVDSADVLKIDVHVGLPRSHRVDSKTLIFRTSTKWVEVTLQAKLVRRIKMTRVDGKLIRKISLILRVFNQNSTPKLSIWYDEKWRQNFQA